MRRAVSGGRAEASVFVYDLRALRGEAAGWLGETEGAAGTPATVRGHLFRGPRGRLGLVPDPAAPPVRGRLVEVTPAQLPVLDFLFAGIGSPLTRRAVDVIVNMRARKGTTWALTETRGWVPLEREGR